MIDARPMIKLDQLVRRFGTTCAVDDVSFTVHQGEVFGYIGPNGAGKTTSMRILATLDVASQGDAYVDGFSVTLDADRVRRLLGFMPDNYGVYPNVSVVEYLDFFARAYGLLGRERTAAIRQTMGFTGLEALAHKAIDNLSKGMKQRLCLGRALIHNPPVLILDEPAAGLDPRARIELREIIRALGDAGRTVLISSHILTELAEMCDRVGIIEQGRLAAVGSIAEIQSATQHRRAVAVTVLERASELADWVRNRGDIGEVRMEGQAVRFLHEGDRDSEAGLLREIVTAGFPVVAFGSHESSLEDVFMQVTRGAVQ
jgi:ABC-2 type transport system ATP-binding protein